MISINFIQLWYYVFSGLVLNFFILTVIKWTIQTFLVILFMLIVTFYSPLTLLFNCNSNNIFYFISNCIFNRYLLIDLPVIFVKIAMLKELIYSKVLDNLFGR